MLTNFGTSQPISVIFTTLHYTPLAKSTYICEYTVANQISANLLANRMKVYGGENVYGLLTCVNADIVRPVGFQWIHKLSDSAIRSFVIA